MKKSWTKRDPIKNYFPLPNEIYQLGLSPGAIAVYGYLLRIEDRTTYQCYPSYSTIGSAVGMSKNTVRKYVAELEERRLIQTAICTGQRPLRHSPSGHHARSERPPNQMADLGLITTV